MFTSKDMSTLNVLIRLRYALWSVEKQHLMKILFLKYFICEVSFSHNPQGVMAKSAQFSDFDYIS